MQPLLRQFWRRPDGTAAVEFGMILLPFTVMLVGMFEILLAFFIANAIELGMGDALRMVRTGEISLMDDPEQAFRDRVCRGAIFADCDEMQFEMTAADSFDEIIGAEPFWLSEEEAPNVLETGEANQIVIARIAFEHRYFTPFMGNILHGNADNAMLITATAIVRNEPF